VQPVRLAQWSVATTDKRGRAGERVAQMEEVYPKNANVNASAIVHLIAEYATSFAHSDITHEELSRMTGLMDEPAKTAVMAYAWFLADADIHNGWLRPYLNASLGRRERPSAARLPAHVKPCVETEGRVGRLSEELHTIYAPPFINRLGHLVWYTIRQARRGEIIGRPASSYARGNNVRIHSSKNISKSLQIHHSQVCNLEVLDLRLWESWTMQARGVGSYGSLANRALSSRIVRFDRPVLVEDALAVGFRVVEGRLINPNGAEMVVSKTPNGLYHAKAPLLRSPSRECKLTQPAVPRECIRWHTSMKFA